VSEDSRDGERQASGGGEARVAELERELREARQRVARLEASLQAQARKLAEVQGSLVWHVATRLRRVRDDVLARSPHAARAWRTLLPAVKDLVRSRLDRQVPPPRPPGSYDAWIARHALTDRELAGLRAEARRAAPPVLLSVLVSVGDTPELLLRRCVESVLAQAWDGWELCVVACSERAAAFSRGVAPADARVRVEVFHGPRAAAMQRALELARGDFVAFLAPEDALAPEALLTLAARLAGEPDLDVLYSDEDRLDPRGRRANPLFKPRWSPDLLLSMDYLGRLTAVRTALARICGGVRTGFEASEEYDLSLRATERTRRIGHVARVLCHRGAAPAAAELPQDGSQPAPVRALAEALARRGIEGSAQAVGPGLYRARYRIRGEPLVSIVMPTRDKAAVLRACVRSVEQRTAWPRWELLVVDNGSTEPEALALLADLARRHRVLRDARPFNWSALNNRAAAEARGEHLLFMNNDMEVISPDWMGALLEHDQRPEVGAVGARLLYPDGRVQHAGVVLGIGGVADHAFKHLPGDAPGYASLGHVVRDVSAVTGACLMTRREVFARVGGFDERLPVAFNDIDYCLKVGRAGLSVVYTPYALLHHHESATRKSVHPPEDEALLRTRWHDVLDDDPFYSPHLARDRLDYALGD
jgi:GT2 family glycosyltransferase